MRRTRQLAPLLALTLVRCTDAAGPDAAPPAAHPGLDPVSAPLVYGADDRKEYFQVTDFRQKRLADATAVVVSPSVLTQTATGYSLSTATTFGATYSLCSDEPFATQPDPGYCTAFAVGSDLVATAGHCVSNNECASTWFVFGFRLDAANTVRKDVPAQDVYKCASIVGRTSKANDDWAVVRVDRAITGRMPLRLRRTGSVPLAAPLVVAGHPAGIPVKVAANATVTDTAPANFFAANLDTYGGNSGSPVMNATTGLVEGILVRGNDDFVYDATRQCYRSNVCADTGCPSWEEVSRATRFVQYVPDVPECLSGADCSDGDGCNGAELCTDGACRPGPIVSCKDNDACTRDACTTVAGQAVCTHTPVACDDGNACSIDTCDPTRGCVIDPIVCPVGERCQAGACTPIPACRAAREACTKRSQCCSGVCDPLKLRCR